MFLGSVRRKTATIVAGSNRLFRTVPSELCGRSQKKWMNLSHVFNTIGRAGGRMRLREA